MTEESKVPAEAPQETGLILPNKPQDKHNLLIFTGQEGKTYQNFHWTRFFVPHGKPRVFVIDK